MTTSDIARDMLGQTPGNGVSDGLAEPWRSLTLPGLLMTAARTRARRLAVLDAPDAEAWAGRPRQAWSCSDLAERAIRIARQMHMLRLKPGDAVIVLLGNQTEAFSTCLGLMMGGLVPIPLPVVAEQADILGAAEATQARAIVTVSRFAGLSPAVSAVQCAAALPRLRSIAAYGADLPPGIVSLDDWPESEIDKVPLPLISPGDTALLSLGIHDGRLVPHRRTHAQLIAEGLAIAASVGANVSTSLIATIAPVSAAGIATGFVVPLLTGATLHLHGPISTAILDAQLQQSPGAVVVMPLRAEAALRAHLGPRLQEAIVINRGCPPAGGLLPLDSQRRIVDLTALGETLLLVQRRPRSGGTQRFPRAYRHPAPDVMANGGKLAELQRAPSGLLQARGFGLAKAADQTASSLVLPFVALDDGPNHLLLVEPGTTELVTGNAA